MWWWVLGVALAGPGVRGGATAIEDRVVPPPNVEIVPQIVEGSVRLVMAGRDGDSVFVDGWPAGVLPVVTQLAEGPHTFRVEGKTGKHEIELMVTVVSGRVPDIDLALPPPEPPPVTPPAPK